eukprot:1158442-Pelagomonas_calceolata.AAC.6
MPMSTGVHAQPAGAGLDTCYMLFACDECDSEKRVEHLVRAKNKLEKKTTLTKSGMYIKGRFP